MIGFGYTYLIFGTLLLHITTKLKIRMKKILTMFTLVFVVQLVSLAQTKKPATTKKTVTNTKPTTATKPATTATRPVSVAPPATTTTAPEPVAAPTPEPKAVEPAPQDQQNRQELYDKYHGTAPKPATPANNQKSRTATTIKSERATEPAKSNSVSRQEMSRATEYESKGSRESKFSVGFRGGVNLANFGEAGKFTTEGVESPMTFHGGLIFNIGGKTLSVQPEVLFSQIGIKTAINTGISPISVETVINTVQVPVLLKLSLGGNAFRFFINGGGYGSYMLSGKGKISINGGTPVEEKITFDDNDGRIEYGVVGGAGIQLGLGSVKVLLEGRYNYGLGNNAPKVQGMTESYSRVMMGSVGVLIPLGGR
ncbi:MAG: PorT family protein [Runella slithyformis]|nr:MAG: PorT family protein [Runella slithyformis]TAF94380.1 MAG: PorT family protein [Runella sp.]TAG18053.1 MAG: PorT family protein [Cytophagales bacterium]TAG37580.1 MAG: PorT family protein [Cytophagia bacterium]TAE99390.1 MAG: PorT family protein [Runella slithyformis]